MNALPAVNKACIAFSIMVALAALTGCGPQPKTLEGTVKEEFGTASRIVESSGALFGNEAVKFSKPTYGLVLESGGKTYSIRVVDSYKKPVIALAKAIEPGDTVRITYNSPYLNYSTVIDTDGVGTTPSSTIEILKKAKR